MEYFFYHVIAMGVSTLIVAIWTKVRPDHLAADTGKHVPCVLKQGSFS